jgi:putative nucleotidyltransferase with HDIG domain
MKDKQVHFFREEEPLQRDSRFIRIFLGVSFLGAALIVVFALQFERIFPRYNIADFKLLAPAPYQVIPARDIVFEDEARTAKKRDEAEQAALLVFQFDNNKTRVVFEKSTAFKEYISAKRKNAIDAKKELLYQNRGVTTLISEETLALFQGLGEQEFDEAMARSETLLLELMNNGVFSFSGIDRDPFDIKTVQINREAENKTITSEKSLAEIITRQSLPTWLENKLMPLKLSGTQKECVRTLVLALADENCRFDLATTAQNRKKARESVLPVQDILQKNFPIVGKGQAITSDLYAKLVVFWKNSETDAVSRITSTLLFLALIFLTGLFLLGKTLSGRIYPRGELLFLVIMGLIYLILSILIFRTLPLEGKFPLTVLLPTAAIAVITTIIVSPYAGIAFSFLLALVALLIQNEMSTFLFAFFSGIAGTAAVIRVAKRIDLVKAGFVCFFINGVLMLVICIIYAFSFEETAIMTMIAALNGFFSLIISIGFLPLFEHALNAPTRFRLMELSDTNVPILKKMLVLAPGTYSHSVNVANLSESATLAVGANALLARVGAYYHDIGKIDSPEYFIENQDALNKHDFLKPSLSAAVIKSHVKIGVEKAKELDLPQEVINIIAQHHGKGLISYFFNRAKVENTNGDEISPDDYSYQGTRPQTKEAAIVMLADAVEAASRTLKKPTPSKIEKLIWQIMIERFHSEELLECNLTFHDLEIVKQVFVQIIQGYLHQRIEYPKRSESDAVPKEGAT